MGSLCCNAHQIDVIVAVCACVRRYVNDAQTKSDAVVCAQLCPICPARGWGVVWLFISLGFWAGGVCYLVLHVGGHLDL